MLSGVLRWVLPVDGQMQKAMQEMDEGGPLVDACRYEGLVCRHLQEAVAHMGLYIYRIPPCTHTSRIVLTNLRYLLIPTSNLVLRFVTWSVGHRGLG